MKHFYAYLICLAVCYLLPITNAAHNSQYFKVPHNPNRQFDEDRPPRLVDDKSDPDMVKLKSIQERFFSIVSNTSLATEFNGFTDLLSLMESGIGKQLGIVFASGVGIGFRKENSFELLSEFWDEFKFRLPHGLSEALVDYTDFARSVDISLIPMTMDLLFQKDNLGNSLAQMPIGQLIDLVQPEASRYGIDIRSFVNGIIGKGDSKFPDLIRSSMQNLNFKSILQNVVDIIPKELGTKSQSTDSSEVTKIERTEKTLHLFKPLIANLLKSNKIDLEADAVIQVMLPFFRGASEYASKFLEDGGNGLNLAMLAPFIGMLTTGNDKNSNPLALFASLMENQDANNNNGMSNILNIVSHLMGNKKHPTDTKNKDTGGFDISNLLQIAGQLSGNDGKMDIGSLINTAASFMSNEKDGPKGGENIMGMLGKLSKGETIDPGELLQTAASVIQNLQPEKRKESIDKKSEAVNAKETGAFQEAAAPMIIALKNDKKLQNQLNGGIKQIKHFLKSKKISTNNIESFLLSVSGLPKLPETMNVQLFNSMFSFSYKEWRDFLMKLEDKRTRKNVISQVSSSAAQLVSMIAADDFDRQIYDIFMYISSALEGYGIKDITLDNFSEKLESPLKMVSMIYDIPMDLVPLLEPLKSFVKKVIELKKQNSKYIRQIPKQELLKVVSQYLDKDVFLPLYEVWKTYDKNLETINCLPRVFCDVINKMEVETSRSALKVAFTRLASFAFGISTVYKSKNFELIGDMVMASFFKLDDCQESFPISCSQTDDKLQRTKHDYEKQMHEEL